MEGWGDYPSPPPPHNTIHDGTRRPKSMSTNPRGTHRGPTFWVRGHETQAESGQMLGRRVPRRAPAFKRASSFMCVWLACVDASCL
ncbi:hypothetical protein BaRGS_00013724 [Batillaria attramentaria]|uniref:Uncharacterized protein n=1 Tax=Batillaria attramentaria TaxID=370345 RepID=A0ABD0L7M5_9CAEN